MKNFLRSTALLGLLLYISLAPEAKDSPQEVPVIEEVVETVEITPEPAQEPVQEEQPDLLVVPRESQDVAPGVFIAPEPEPVQRFEVIPQEQPKTVPTAVYVPAKIQAYPPPRYMAPSCSGPNCRQPQRRPGILGRWRRF